MIQGLFRSSCPRIRRPFHRTVWSLRRTGQPWRAGVIRAFGSLPTNIEDL